ncbi:DivIVA domain-containing protein [bacterium]|nr:DivIVA domain-containing protein [bacterium]
MKIGPVDIRNHVFSRKKMRGFDEAEVAAFLELVADALEESIVEQEELHGRIARLEADLLEYRDLDRTLRDSLLSAERLSDGRLEQAERESRIILKNAEVEGEKLIGRARAEADSLRSSLDDLRAQRLTYVERFRALLRSQSRILEASVESFSPELAEVERTLDRIDETAADLPPFVGEEEAPLVSPKAGRPAAGSTPSGNPYLGEDGLFSRTADSSRLEED